MKKVLLFSLVLLLTAITPSFAGTDIDSHPSCPYCGMDRGKYAHSRMLIVYNDGSRGATCSIRCLALEDGLHIDKDIRVIGVGDYDTHDLIDAEEAFWILGGEKSGVMTRRAKWAFKTKEQAKAFQAKWGGELVTFETAFQAAFEDFFKDTQMIRKRRKARRAKRAAKQ